MRTNPVEVIEVESRHQLSAAVLAQLIAEKLKLAAYPRSARYDVDWVLRDGRRTYEKG